MNATEHSMMTADTFEAAKTITPGQTITFMGRSFNVTSVTDYQALGRTAALEEVGKGTDAGIQATMDRKGWIVMLSHPRSRKITQIAIRASDVTIA